jgi:hypothetical protein
MRHYIFPLAVLLGCMLVSPTLASKVGDPAFPLSVKQWVKGRPVDVKDGKNVYVVVFWDVSSEACKACTPLLTDLQKKYADKGVTVVAVCAKDAVEKVQSYLDEQGDKVGFRVASDNDHSTMVSYMMAFHQDTVPMAFIVGKDAKILGFGHPRAGLTNGLDDILSGKFDLQAAIKADTVRAALDEYKQFSRDGDPRTKECGRKILAESAKDPAALCKFAYAIATDVVNKGRDFALAEEAINLAEKVQGRTNAQSSMMRGITRFESGKPDEGLALVKKAIDLEPDAKIKAGMQRYLKIMESRKDRIIKQQD